MPAMPDALHPFAQLTPDFVQDALSDLGLMGDGRLTPLNSYENRVYLAHLEPGTPLPSRTRRWCSSSTAPGAGATRRSWRSTPLPPS
jgi:hypothetical protein